MQQEFVQIGEVSFPIIIEEGVRYYPVSYITTKILLRSGKNSLMSKSNKEQFESYMKKLVVTFGEKNIQETNCISEEGLRLLLSKTQHSRLTFEQRSSQNKLHEHLELPLLTLGETIVTSLSEDLLNEHDLYTRDLILASKENSQFQLCSKCDKYYPMTGDFYMINNRVKKGLTKVCRNCAGKIKKSIQDEEASVLFEQVGDQVYDEFKNHNVISVFESYYNGELKIIPTIFQNKKDYAKLIKHLYHKYNVPLQEIGLEYFRRNFKLHNLGSYYNTNDIHVIIFGDYVKYHPWKYPAYRMGGNYIDTDYAVALYRNYLSDMNIEIENIFTFKYSELLRKVRIRIDDLLKFVVKLNDSKYPGYMYKIHGNNYYKDEDNVLFDLKYLIEKHINIPVDKIPLYLTKNTLQQKCRPLYNHIVTNKNKTIYEWVDKLYPNKFIEADFEVNTCRNEFDSDTECFIHEILTDMFDNVIYNQKHTNRTITIDGMIPDWLVFTTNGVWIIEYFGMYVERQKHNTRVRDYIEKTHRKIERYKQLSGYEFIYLFPEDIEDDYNGCREKLSKIGLKSIVSRD